MKALLLALFLISFRILVFAQSQFGPDVLPFVSVNAPVFAIEHVRLIDGTGTPEKEDQTVVVVNGRVQSIGPSTSTPIPAGAAHIEGRGRTVMPGLVGMHDHLYYTASASDQLDANGKVGEPGIVVNEIPYTAPRLYLAAGVTTMRTTGSLEPYADLRVKRLIDERQWWVPKLTRQRPIWKVGQHPSHRCTRSTVPMMRREW
jgi:imidazolonepropionase-like amidohydrolase